MEYWGLTNPSGPRQVADNRAGQESVHPSKLQIMLESSKGLQPASLDGRQIRYTQISTPETSGSRGSVLKRDRPLSRALEFAEGGAAILCGIALAQVCERRHRARNRKAGFRSASKLSRRAYNSQPATPAKKEEPWELLGVPLTADFTAVGLAYFAQGALALAALAKPFYVKDTLGLSPADSSLFLSFTYWPWIMKPLWGFVADSIPIFGSRRQAYLVLAGAISVIGWLGLAGWWPVEVSKEATLVFMVMGNFGIAFSDVVVDGLVVEKARDDPKLMGGLQSFSWACRGFGAILSAYFSGALLEMIGVQQVFAVTALLPLLVIVAAVLIREPPQPSSSSNYSLDWDEAKQLGQQVWEVIRSPDVFPAVLFILAWQATPTAGSATFYFYTNELHFNPEFLGRSQLVGSLASLAGIVLYNRVFSSVPIKDYLTRIQVTAVTLGFLPILLATRANLALNIPDQMFVLGDDVIQTVAGELAHMPILVLAAQLCPRGIEATLFALLMSALNAASFLSSSIGAYLTHVLEVTDSDFSNYAFLLLICNLSGLLPLALLPGIRSQPSRRQPQK